MFITLRYCRNELRTAMNRQPCDPIGYHIDDFSFNFGFTKFYLDMEDRTKPVKYVPIANHSIKYYTLKSDRYWKFDYRINHSELISQKTGFWSQAFRSHEKTIIKQLVKKKAKVYYLSPFSYKHYGPYSPYKTKEQTFLSISIGFGDKQIRTTRDYLTFFDLLSKIGGMFGILRELTSLFYEYYNEIQLYVYLIYKTFLKNYIIYPNNYDIKESYLFCKICILKHLCKCCFPKNELDDDHDQPDSNLDSKAATLKVCNEFIENSLELKNYVQNSMDIKLISHLLLKSRHK